MSAGAGILAAAMVNGAFPALLRHQHGTTRDQCPDGHAERSGPLLKITSWITGGRLPTTNARKGPDSELFVEWPDARAVPNVPRLGVRPQASRRTSEAVMRYQVVQSNPSAQLRCVMGCPARQSSARGPHIAEPPVAGSTGGSNAQFAWRGALVTSLAGPRPARDGAMAPGAARTAGAAGYSLRLTPTSDSRNWNMLMKSRYSVRAPNTETLAAASESKLPYRYISFSFCVS
jgi:hypothetical protein